MDKSGIDNRSNQLNPNNDTYWTSRRYASSRNTLEGPALDNYANQLNPNNDAYWRSRGYSERPEHWGGNTSDKNAQGGSWCTLL